VADEHQEYRYRPDAVKAWDSMHKAQFYNTLAQGAK